MYRRGYFIAESVASFAKVSTGIGLIVMISLCMRGLGRSKSRSYTKFAKVLQEVQQNKDKPDEKRKLQMFDFDFRDWPVDFSVHDVME